MVQTFFEFVCHCLRPLIRRRVAKTHCSLENVGQRGLASSDSRILSASASAATSPRRRTRAIMLLICAISMQLARADVIVLANRAGIQIPLRFLPVAGEAQHLTLPPDATVPLYLDGKADILF